MPPPAKPTMRRPVSADAVARIDAACQQVVAGKLAAREVAAWAGELGVTEVEFRLLWILGWISDVQQAGAALDQAALAAQLAVSPAQVSSVVERLRSAGYVATTPLPADRRRQLWRITLAGQLLISNVSLLVERSPCGPATKGAA